MTNDTYVYICIYETISSTIFGLTSERIILYIKMHLKCKNVKKNVHIKFCNNVIFLAEISI